MGERAFFERKDARAQRHKVNMESRSSEGLGACWVDDVERLDLVSESEFTQ